jgi:hypothetical protein
LSPFSFVWKYETRQVMKVPTPPNKGRGPKLNSAEAQARLADALRENLRRRKAQIKARDAVAPALGEEDAQDHKSSSPPPGKSR